MISRPKERSRTFKWNSVVHQRDAFNPRAMHSGEMDLLQQPVRQTRDRTSKDTAHIYHMQGDPGFESRCLRGLLSEMRDFDDPSDIEARIRPWLESQTQMWGFSLLKFIPERNGAYHLPVGSLQRQ
ncbi:hypothetical protein CDAR_412151 [Caerostris darwini]|uniref:Uncharacterized protein n=1 Tax=Caerostris darwini TaxID=1538125 RepID=A0AAV4WC37_9ARAC|nr:hypothetical protein CDAR_412151 [Caerostris darwini]